jgi:oligopeptide/dipeptide ABC transporter ATP-binding protein
MKEELLKVHGLKTYFYTRQGIVKAVDGVSFEIGKGETFGLVGESGCGKSVSALSVMRLVPDPPGKIVSGDILFKGKNLRITNEDEMRKIRGSKMSMIFQDPTSSLNPVMKIGDQILESIQEHQELDKAKAKEKAVELMDSVGIPNPSLRFAEYPFQFSGGMRQRIMIAMAISCNPDLLIADEPTTNLDVTVQAQVLDLIRNISRSDNVSVLLITHNLGLIAWLCDRVAVMYSGKIVEHANVEALFADARHPYTKALLECIPRLGEKDTKGLRVIAGRVPNLINLPSGCRFHPRCSHSMGICAKEEPKAIEVASGHWVSCHLMSNSKEGY